MKKFNLKIKKQKFLLISIIIHIFIFLIFQNYSLFNKGYKKPLKYLEITDISSPDSNKLDNNSKRLAENSNKALNEKIKKAPIKNLNKKSLRKIQSKESRKNDSNNDKESKDFGDLEYKKKNKEKKIAEDSTMQKETIFNPGPTDPESNDEVTVDFNTQEFKYISYFLRIKRKIEMTWSYPKSSLQRGETGQVVLKISLDKTGKLNNIKTLKSSGYIDLDKEAKSAIFQAAPFGPFPSAWTLKKLNINITFNYSPQGWYY
tara:strand:+ start:20907 stop:21686 length:780 start_codon:yes stop_codon:yes gene_type:complete